MEKRLAEQARNRELDELDKMDGVMMKDIGRRFGRIYKFTAFGCVRWKSKIPQELVP